MLKNSRTEPLPLPSPQTPQKQSFYGLATPQTSDRFRPKGPEVTTPYTPSKRVSTAPSSSTRRPETQSSTTQGSDTEEEFYDWPASDDDELSKAANQASSGNSMPPLETPRKAMKKDVFSTPGKRRYDDMASEGEVTSSSAWPTPSTVTGGNDIFNTPATGATGKCLFSTFTLPTPAETPTPIRYKDVPPTQESELTSEILTMLQTHQVALPAGARDAVKSICDKHVLRTRGIMRGRDVSRAMVKIKDEKITEMQSEIEGLRAERETNRAVIKHLRRDAASRKETGT